MPLNNDDFSKFVEWVREHRLPMHVTIPDLDKLLGPSTDTFLKNLWALNRKLQKKTGLWMEMVIYPGRLANRSGQISLRDVYAPEAGPFWIPDSHRSLPHSSRPPSPPEGSGCTTSLPGLTPTLSQPRTLFSLSTRKDDSAMKAPYPDYKLPKWAYDEAYGNSASKKCHLKFKLFVASPETLASNVALLQANYRYSMQKMAERANSANPLSMDYLEGLLFYLTVYRKGQKSLFPSAREPDVGPYWIPDRFRS